MNKLFLLLLIAALPACAQDSSLPAGTVTGDAWMYPQFFALPQLPEAPAPQPQPKHEFNRYSGHEILGWKEAARGKAFLVPYGALWAASIADAEITHQGIAHHRCDENPSSVGLPRHPSRGALYKEMALENVPITALGYLMRKLGFRWWTYDVPAAVGVGIHLHGAASWLGECW